jgi:hypothetical protein
MEPLWSPVDATGGNQSQVTSVRNRPEISQNRCRGLRPAAADSTW